MKRFFFEKRHRDALLELARHARALSLRCGVTGRIRSTEDLGEGYELRLYDRDNGDVRVSIVSKTGTYILFDIDSDHMREKNSLRRHKVRVELDGRQPISFEVFANLGEELLPLILQAIRDNIAMLRDEMRAFDEARHAQLVAQSYRQPDAKEDG